MLNRRHFAATAAAAAASLPFAGLQKALAQIAGNAFIISGFPAGGMGDLVSRPLAEKMRGTYASNVLVESKVGAGGRIATEFVKKAPPDGLTILQIPSSVMTLYPHTYQSINYDPLADFIPVTSTATYTFSFTASSALPAEIKTVADFVTWAKANPTKSSYGIPAAGSALHFAGMMLQRATGIEFSAVPYRGGAPLLTDMLAGVIPVSFNVIGEVLPHVRDGKLRSLAVTSAARSPFLPNVPTMVEQGYKDIALTEWLGWFLPKGTSPDIVQKLNTVVRDGLASQDMIDSLAKSGLQPRYMTSADFAANVKSDLDRWAPVVKATGFSATD